MENFFPRFGITQMQNRRHTTTKWHRRKAEIILKFGSITGCANHIGCSTEALRLAEKGKCPGIARKLEAALAS